jgi:hypothetical protein
MVQIDISNAFGSVPQDLILSNMVARGILPTITKLGAEYLHGQQFEDFSGKLNTESQNSGPDRNPSSETSFKVEINTPKSGSIEKGIMSRNLGDYPLSIF